MADHDEQPTLPQDAKDRFREALERKNEAAHRTADGARNTGSVHGPEVSGSARRTFRRKTG
jgi:ssDNA-binding replication factor A large subunit